MKASNKSSLITGIVLLALAAVFSISLILQGLDFGVAGPSHNNIFYLLGNMIFSVYGFSSIAIPLFLLISGLSCFATKWTSQKTMRLLTAVFPFFTCVVTEKVCRSALKNGTGSAATVRIVIALITGIMLAIIEILGAGIIAEKVNQRLFHSGKKYKEPVFDSDALHDEDELVPEEPEPDTVVEEEPVEEYNPEPLERVEFKPIKKSTVFDKALSRLSFGKKTDDETEEYGRHTEASEDDEPVTEQDEAVLSDDGEPLAEKAQTEAASAPDSGNEELRANPASIITQEEYAALIQPEEEPAEEAPIDEMEWPNLPAAPKELPAEYVDSPEENDPALEFPPKDAEPEAPVQIPYDIQEEAVEAEAPANEVESPDPEETQAADTQGVEDSFEEIDELTESSEQDDVYGLARFDQNIKMEDSASVLQDSNPYADAQYIQRAVTSKSVYPTEIVIHEDGEADDTEDDLKKNTSPKYPTEIVLDDFDGQPSEEDELEAELDSFVQADDALAQNNGSAETAPEGRTLAPDFFDIDLNAEEDDEALSDDEEPYEAYEEPLTEDNLSASVSSVFSDMEADIRRGLPAVHPEPGQDDEAEEPQVQPEPAATDNVLIQETELTDSAPAQNPNANHATNLTADELSDFFNAQQAENKPADTKALEGGVKVSNRAAPKGPYSVPSNLLTAYKDDQYWIIDDATKQAALSLKQTLGDFNIDADIIGIKKGPVVTMFEILPAPGVKLSKIVALQDNIALSLAAQSVRIVAPIPGKQAVGIEVPNKERSIVGFREIIEMDLPEYAKMAVPVILGKDILGKAQLIDLVKTPHLLIAGATGSGKSVCVNSLILSILYKRSYNDVKLILVDPKVVELKLYNNIPHLLCPVITEPKRAFQALQYCLSEMERRYALLDGLGVRDISSYNQRIIERHIATQKLPYIVVIIDEFADLMATSGKELETTVARLTAMSRAVGIHLVLATQRPSVNVITGLIKANIPSRIAFMVASRTDSNIIIDSVGAEKLLGRGDMLYASAVDPAPVRIQGTYISDQEVEDVVDYVKSYGEPDYIDDEIFFDDDEDSEEDVDLFGNAYDEDPLYDQALEIVVQTGKASASFIQRKLKIGYNRAARLVEEMEERGIVGPANGSKPREIIHMP